MKKKYIAPYDPNDMSMIEKQLAEYIKLEAGKHGLSLLINNSGALNDEVGRLVRFGIGNESKEINDRLKFPDYVFILPTIIQPHHVGMKIGIFAGAELKRPDWEYTGKGREQAQMNAIEFIRLNGGVAGFVNSVDSFNKLIGR